MASSVDKPGEPSFVPFHRACAVVGYAVVCAAALLLFLEAASFIVLKVHARFFPAPYIRNLRAAFGPCRGISDPKCQIKTDADMSSASAVYDREPWAEELWREQRMVYDRRWLYDPFLYWRHRPFHGSLINVSETAFGTWRNTTGPPPRCAGKTAKQVWIFGGSVVLGVGNPDFATMPSQLSDRLNAAGPDCFAVTNFGVQGYNTTQELMLLVRQLQWHKPDVVIFYDGFNDAYVGAHDPAVAYGHMDMAMARAAFERSMSYYTEPARYSHAVTLARVAWARLHRAPQGEDASDLSRLSRETLVNYQNNIGSVRALAKTYGFTVFFYWQPWLLSRAALAPQEKAMVQNPNLIDPDGQDFLKQITAVYAEAEQRAPNGGFTLLSHLFDAEKQTIFIDEVHTGPLGSKIVAERIAADVLR